jgi:hypothetical protein
MTIIASGTVARIERKWASFTGGLVKAEAEPSIAGGNSGTRIES